MGTIASRPASSASRAAASVFSQVGMRISGTKLMLGMVLVQKVPSFSLLSLKIGFVEFFTREIVPDICGFAQRWENGFPDWSAQERPPGHRYETRIARAE